MVGLNAMQIRPAGSQQLDQLVSKQFTENINWKGVFNTLNAYKNTDLVNEYRLLGRTLLIWAIDKDNFSAAKALLEEYKANPNITISEYPYTKFSPLMIACIRGNVEMVKLLLRHGADPKLKTDWGHTAMGLAEDNGHSEIVELLQKKMY
jgi:ankyrin repeat protein